VKEKGEYGEKRTQSHVVRAEGDGPMKKGVQAVFQIHIGMDDLVFLGEESHPDEAVQTTQDEDCERDPNQWASGKLVHAMPL
jgi:hypothetical protein